MQQERLLSQTLHIHNEEHYESFLKLLKPSRLNTLMLSKTFWQSHHIEHLNASLICSKKLSFFTAGNESVHKKLTTDCECIKYQPIIYGSNM